MEKEISSGAMLGIVLIALAAIIGLGFGVFAIAKGTANEGVTSVQENLDAVGQSAYNDYDQKIVTGTQVNSAYQNFNGKNVAFLIATQAMKDAIETSVDGVETAAGVDTGYGEDAIVPVVWAYADEDMTSPFVMTTSDNVEVTQAAFMNYNALLYGAGGNGTGDDAPDKEYGQMYFDDNCFRSTDGFATKAGKVLFNNVTVNMAKSGMMEYIPSGGRFQSYLIKDASGSVVGMSFEQISTSG